MNFFHRLLFCGIALSSVIWAQVDVLTANYDNNRTSANLGEFVLNKSNVNPTQFGKLYSFAVDGDVYAQPLYVRGVNISGGARNVLYVATMNNSVYAFDADAATSTVPLWKRNFGPTVDPSHFDVPGLAFTDILQGIGILGTPVIDPATSTLYVVHYTSSGSINFSYYLHALDLVTGAEKFNGPVMIQASVTGSGWAGLDNPKNNQLPFEASDHLQRPGLLLLNGTVYVAFGSHGDIGPWHGWIIGFDAATLQQTSVFNTTADNAGGASIWQGGRGLAADAAGNIYVATGNGTWDGAHAWGESVLRLTASDLSVTDFFTPVEWIPLNGNDTDLGSTGPILIPGTNLLCEIGKEGVLFLLDQTNLGHQAPMNNQVLQSFQAASPGITELQQESSFLVFNTAFWDNVGGQILYMWPYGEPPRSYRMSNGVFRVTPFSVNKTAVNQKPFPGLTVSAFGSLSNSGILWATSADTKLFARPRHLARLRCPGSYRGVVEFQYAAEPRYVGQLHEIRQSDCRQRQSVRAHGFQGDRGLWIVAWRSRRGIGGEFRQLFLRRRSSRRTGYYFRNQRRTSVPRICQRRSHKPQAAVCAGRHSGYLWRQTSSTTLQRLGPNQRSGAVRSSRSDDGRNGSQGSRWPVLQRDAAGGTRESLHLFRQCVGYGPRRNSEQRGSLKKFRR